MNIIITGASGLIATQLAQMLLQDSSDNLFLLSEHPNSIDSLFLNNNRVHIFTLNSFQEYAINNPCHFDVCINAAFSRSNSGNLIVSSLNYLKKLIECIKETDISTFLNISSQSVYGTASSPLWKESASLDPNSLYSLGKYASEQITELMLSSSNIKWANIRLCSVCGNARFVQLFVKNAIEGKSIRLTAPNQQCSFIDERDTAKALTTLIHTAPMISLEHTYNLGANYVNTIEEIALLVKKIGEDEFNTPKVEIIYDQSDNPVRIGMDASVFMKTFNWAPSFDIKDMIVSVFEKYEKN
ncbi:MAG: NAD(P)-dependent oxidoreductase [Bacteroidales bacterium]|nr:NAD(P)-dependent oxidoreductase [Bacteroidales bacterium]